MLASFLLATVLDFLLFKGVPVLGMSLIMH